MDEKMRLGELNIHCPGSHSQQVVAAAWEPKSLRSYLAIISSMGPRIR